MSTYRRNRRGQVLDCDVKGKRVDRAFVARVQIAAAAATVASNVNVLAATAQTAAAQTITANITQPSVPRNLIVKGNAVGNAGNVVVTGINYEGAVITETFALNGSTAVVGAKAFRAVTSIALPAETHAGTDTVSLGTGEKLGLPYKLAHNTVQQVFKDNTLEGTAATVTVSATAIESNTVDLNSALNSKAIDIYLFV
jgi:hypothetical protein